MNFREQLAERAKTEEHFNVQAPSGLIYKLRRINFQNYLAAGYLPEAFLEYFYEQNKAYVLGTETDARAAFEKMTAEEYKSAMKFRRETVVAACVVPKIVETPATDDEARFEELPDGDAAFICGWVQIGGAIAEGLKKSSPAAQSSTE
jgi:hypothetical protein